MTLTTRLTLTLWLLALPPAASACNVPVCRYALERWPVSPYVAVVIADAPLTVAEAGALSLLEKAADGTSGTLNLTVRQWTSEELAQSPLGRAATAPEGRGAHMQLFFPLSEGIRAPIWSGALTEASAGKIMGSAFRKTLARKLVAGDSGVYILLESGNKARDDAAAKALDAHLAEIRKTLTLPEGVVTVDGRVTGDGAAGQDPTNQLQSSIPLNVAFSALRLSRVGVDDLLVGALLSLEDDLMTFRDDPMVFAVYGRARVLPPLVGKGITRDNVGEIAAYLTGPCSCQVKALNPGVDLLLDHDWDRSVFGEGRGRDE